MGRIRCIGWMSHFIASRLGTDFRRLDPGPLDPLIYCGMGSLISGDHISLISYFCVMRRRDPVLVWDLWTTPIGICSFTTESGGISELLSLGDPSPSLLSFDSAMSPRRDVMLTVIIMGFMLPLEDKNTSVCDTQD